VVRGSRVADGRSATDLITPPGVGVDGLHDFLTAAVGIFLPCPLPVEQLRAYNDSMVAVDYAAGRANGSAQWAELLVLALLAVLLLVIVGRLACRRLVRYVRHSDLDAASAVSGVVATAAAGEDPDLLVLRTAFELRRLLRLDDCRWAWLGDPRPVATLDDDGVVRFGDYRWPVERYGLPPHGVARPLLAGQRPFGWIVLHPASSRPVEPARLQAAVTMTDVLAVSLDRDRHPVTPDRSV
jgi:hypothetical protein